MRTKTFDAILELLADRRWHTENELAERTRYPDHWIDELRRESALEIEERDGQTLIRLRAGVAA
ncbi:MAG TPA: hypothetical protein VH305_08565 [Gaiella sp.]|jgi:hypothetical protein